jgi:hypothetical protein
MASRGEREGQSESKGARERESIRTFFKIGSGIDVFIFITFITAKIVLAVVLCLALCPLECRRHGL